MAYIKLKCGLEMWHDLMSAIRSRSEFLRALTMFACCFVVFGYFCHLKASVKKVVMQEINE